MNPQKIKFKTYITLFLIQLTIILINSPAKAQNDLDDTKFTKYELSIDLIPIIDQGQFGKVYFKINNYKEEQLKGAYRVGVSKGTYLKYEIDQSSLLENQSSSYVTDSHFESVLHFGYEKYKKNRISTNLLWFRY